MISIRNRISLSVCLLVFIDSVGLGLIFPILPTLFINTQYGLTVHVATSHINLLYGLAIATFPLASLFGMPILGKMSDKLGRKKALLLGVSGLMLGYTWGIVALCFQNVWLFLIARFISGFSSGTYSVCSAAMMDISTEGKEKISALKYLTLSNVTGFIFGPALSVFMHKNINTFTLSLPFAIALCFCMVNALLLFFLYPKSIKTIQQETTSKKNNFFRGKEIIESIYFIFKQNLSYLLFGYLLFNLGFQIFLQSQSIYLAEAYKYNMNQIGLFFALMGLSLTFSMFMLKQKIDAHMSPELQIKTGLVGIGAILVFSTLFSVLFNSVALYHICITWGTSFIFYILTPFVTLNMIKLFSDLTSKDTQGNLMGALGQLTSLSTVFGALIMSVLLSIGRPLNSGLAGALILVSYLFINFSLINLKNTTKETFNEQQPEILLL